MKNRWGEKTSVKVSCRYEIYCRSREIKIDGDMQGGAESAKEDGVGKERHYVLQGISLLEFGRLLEA